MQQLRKTGDQQLEAQRWQAQQAHIQAAALSGQFGTRTQLLAMSAAYAELMANGQVEQAKALKAQAMAIVEAQ